MEMHTTWYAALNPNVPQTLPGQANTEVIII